MRWIDEQARSLNRPLAGAVAAALVIAVVLFENVVPPWAPFFYAGAALTIIIALLAQPIMQARRLAWADLGPAAIALVAVALVEVVALGPSLNLLTHALSASGRTYMTLNAALTAMLGKASLVQEMPLETAITIYAVYFLVWAPIGEELFYRGYLLRAFASFPPLGAAVLSSAFFALRHLAQLFYLESPLVVPAAFAWGIATFLSGLVMCWMVRRTGSLWLAIGVHFAVNTIGVVAN